MIDMSMGQNHRIQAGGRERQGHPIALTQGLEPLEQTAVDEHASGLGLDEIAGAGDGAYRTRKRDSHDLPRSSERANAAFLRAAPCWDSQTAGSRSKAAQIVRRGSSRAR